MYIQLNNNKNLKSNIEKIKKFYGEKHVRISCGSFVQAYNNKVHSFINYSNTSNSYDLVIYETENHENELNIPISDLSTVYDLD